MYFGPPWVMKAHAIWVGLATLGEVINGASVGTGVLKMNCGFCEYEVILMIISTLGCSESWSLSNIGGLWEYLS